MKVFITTEIAKDILKHNSVAQFRVYYAVLYFCSGKYDPLHDLETVQTITGIKDKYLINRYLKQLVEAEYAETFEGIRTIHLMKGINRLYGFKFLRRRDHKVQLPTISILGSNKKFRTFLYTIFEVTKMGKSVVHNKLEYARQSLSYVAFKIDKGLSTIAHHRSESSADKWIDKAHDYFIIEENVDILNVAVNKQMILEGETIDFGATWSNNLKKGLSMFGLTDLSYNDIYSRLTTINDKGKVHFVFILSTLIRSNLNVVKFKVKTGKEQSDNIQMHFMNEYMLRKGNISKPVKSFKSSLPKYSKINLTKLGIQV